MILKQTRVQVGGSGSLLAHINNEEDNDLVTVLHGNDNIPGDGDIIARMNNRKYGNRHIVISPQFALSPEQLNFVLALIFDEVDPEGAIGDDYLLIQHNKRRHDGLHDAPHYHLVINESTAAGHQLNQQMMYLKNEKIARLCELEFGHPLTKGKHNKAVVKHLEENGYLAEAEALRVLTSGSPALAAFSSKQLRRAERLGVDLPGIYYAIKDISDPVQLAEALANIEEEHEVSVRMGDTRNVLIIEQEGQIIADLRKLFKNKDLNHEYINEHITKHRTERCRLQENGQRDAEQNSRQSDRLEQPGRHTTRRAPMQQAGGSNNGNGNSSRANSSRNRQSYGQVSGALASNHRRQLQDERVRVSSRYSNARILRQARKVHEHQSGLNFDRVVQGYRDTVNLVFAIPPLDHPELLRILAEQNRYLGIHQT
ncbi:MULTISPECIES: hypothetical protein [unclassified Aliiroseovarius]|uniref:hypothetical protein n=1 Tax=unclassified Aliiroseovarius TaxID=2623558 RepID=UPI001569018E|nr:MULTISPECIES: hypothetical protein [unclassified Aliiroseovarius]